MMECFNNYHYDCLPDEVIANIYSYLPLHECVNASLTCTTWYKIFNSPLCWKVVEFKFTEKSDRCWLHYIKQYGHNIRRFAIKVDQSQECNRENAISALKSLSGCNLQRLQYFTFTCIGENPLFYAGREFVRAIENMLTIHDENMTSTLKHVDLSQFPMLLDDALVLRLAHHHPNLEYLDIQNKPYICKVSPVSILKLVTSCKKLKDLRLMKCSLSEDILLSLADGKSCALSHLSIKCRSEEKYMNNLRRQFRREQLPSALWANLVHSLPQLRVTLHFDQTCPLNMISIVMKPEIPCSVLRLQTYTMLHEHINFAANHYGGTLEKVVLDTPPSRELNDAVLELSRKCTKLNALHVFCPLDKTTIDQILVDHPEMKENGSFTLESSRHAFMC